MHKIFFYAAALLTGLFFSKIASADWLNCAKGIKDNLKNGRQVQAIKIIENCQATIKYELDSDEYLIFLNNAGLAYAESGFSHEAIEIKKEALALATKRYEAEHFEVINSKLGLAVTYLYAEKPKEALPLLLEAYKVSNQPLFSKPQLALRVQRTLASVYDILGVLDKAVPLATQALKAAEQQKLDPLELSFFQTELALILRKTSNLEATLQLLQAAYQARKTDAPQGNFGVANAAFNLGLAHRDSCSVNEAKKLLQESYEWRLKNLGATHSASIRVHMALESLDEVCGSKRKSKARITKTSDQMLHGLDHPIS